MGESAPRTHATSNSSMEHADERRAACYQAQRGGWLLGPPTIRVSQRTRPIAGAARYVPGRRQQRPARFFVLWWNDEAAAACAPKASDAHGAGTRGGRGSITKANTAFQCLKPPSTHPPRPAQKYEAESRKRKAESRLPGCGSCCLGQPPSQQRHVGQPPRGVGGAQAPGTVGQRWEKSLLSRRADSPARSLMFGVFVSHWHGRIVMACLSPSAA